METGKRNYSDEQWKAAERYLRDQGYRVRKCKTCGFVEYKRGTKWRCGACESR